MNRSRDVVGEYHEAVKAHHAKNREDERRYHDYVIDSLGVKGAAKEQILKERNAAAVAHLIRNPDVRASISKLDDRSQVEELKRIREGEERGPEDDNPDSNTNTDKQLGFRALRIPGHTRRQLVRD